MSAGLAGLSAPERRYEPKVARFRAGWDALRPDRRHQRADTDDVHDPGEIVGEHVQRHLGADMSQRPHQEMGGAHPGLDGVTRYQVTGTKTWQVHPSMRESAGASGSRDRLTRETER